MKNLKRKISLLLSVSMMLFAFNVFSVNAETKSNSYTVNFKYKYGTHNGWYDKNDQGKTVNLKFFLYLNGKNKDTGEVENFWSKAQTFETVVGEDKTFVMDLSGEVSSYKGTVYTDVKALPNAGLYSGFDEDQHIYAYGNNGGNNIDELDAVVMQNANVAVYTEIESDAIILDKHKDDIKINYTIKKIKDGVETYPLTDNAKKPISVELKFADKENVALYNKGMFNTAVDQNTLSQFGIKGNKISEFKLISDFAGDNADELKRLYTLNMDGNDLDGWTLTLGSKIKSKIETSVEEIPFETVYEDDPTLMVGEEKVKQEGTNGIKTTKTEVLYIIDPTNGSEEVLQTNKPTSEITTEPQDQIILRGTKAFTINEIPTITAEDKTITKGDKFNPLEGVSANDKEDGVIALTSDNIIANTVDPNTVGEYEVTYLVADSKGAKATKTIKVVVKEKEVVKPATEETNKPENKELPNTGETTEMFTLMSAGLLTFGAAILISSKKKENNI